MSRKIGSVAIYFLLWLGCFQLKDTVILHTNEGVQRVVFCFFAGLFFAYMNGFDLFKLPDKSKNDKDQNVEKK